MKTSTVFGADAMAALVTYFFDPETGRRRRAQVRDKTLGKLGHVDDAARVAALDRRIELVLYAGAGEPDLTADEFRLLPARSKVPRRRAEAAADLRCGGRSADVNLAAHFRIEPAAADEHSARGIDLDIESHHERPDKLAAEIVPLEGVTRDSGPRPDTSLERLCVRAKKLTKRNMPYISVRGAEIVESC